MRYVSLFLWLMTLPATGQTVLNPDYTPPTTTTQPAGVEGVPTVEGETRQTGIIDSLNSIMTDPEFSRRRQRSYHMILGPGGDHFRERWYLTVEGIIRGNTALLSNTLNGLISTRATTWFGGGVSAGVVLGERWATELAFLYQPLYNNLLLANGRSPISFRYANSGNSLMLRGKVRLGRQNKTSNGSGLWLSGGLGLVPNKGQLLDSLSLRGVILRRRTTADTVRLMIDTYQNKRWSGMAELGAEYVIRIREQTELILSLRWYRALGYSLRTDVSYAINRAEPTVATLSNGGTGWGFGMIWRFNYGLKP